MTAFDGLHHVALTVTDLDVSAGWYQRVLGLEEEFRELSSERRAVVLRSSHGGFAVGLVERGGTDQCFDPTRIGLDHAAFTVASRQEMEDWARRLEEHEVAHSGVIEIPPGAILNFKDPDGIALALFWDR